MTERGEQVPTPIATRVVRWAIIAVALGLHAYNWWHAGALWRDEANTVAMARLPMGQLWGNLGYDSFPLAYFLVLKLWALLPIGALPGETGWRLLGLFTGFAWLAAMLFAGRSLGADRASFFLAVVALNPIVIRFSDSIRPYGCSAVMAVLALAFYWNATNQAGFRAWLKPFLAAMLLMHLHYMNVLVLAAVTLAAAVTLWRRKLPVAPPLLIALMVLLSLGIYAPALKVAATWSNLPAAAGVSLEALGDTVREALNAGNPWGGWCWAVSLPLVAVCVFRRSKDPEAHDAVPFVLTTCVGTVLAFVTLYFKLKWQVSDWYLVPYLTVFGLAGMVLEQRVLWRAAPRPWQILSSIAAVVVMGVAVFPAARELNRKFTNMDTVVASLKGQYKPGDLVIVEPWYAGVSFDFQVRQQKVKFDWDTMPPLPEHSIHRYDLAQQEMAGGGTAVPQLGERIRRTLEGGHKAWIVAQSAPLPDAGLEQQITKQLLDPTLPLSLRYGLTMYRWDLDLAKILDKEANNARAIGLPPSSTMPGLETLRLYVFWK